MNVTECDGEWGNKLKSNLKCSGNADLLNMDEEPHLSL